MQMYRYSGVDTGADALRDFTGEGYKDSEPLHVPPEPSPIDAALHALRSNSKLVRSPQILYSPPAGMLASHVWLLELYMQPVAKYSE